MNAVRYLHARLKEPSSHAGLAALLTLLSILFPAQKPVIAAAGALFAAIAFGMPDATSTATDAPDPAITAEVDAAKS